MDEQSLIYFPLQLCDVLLIGHQFGQLLPNQDLGKLMSLCGAKAEFVLLLLWWCSGIRDTVFISQHRG